MGKTTPSGQTHDSQGALRQPYELFVLTHCIDQLFIYSGHQFNFPEQFNIGNAGFNYRQILNGFLIKAVLNQGAESIIKDQQAFISR